MFHFNVISTTFQAAVCGGIPIIHSLQTDFMADRITKIRGIMNGTTNYMLCKMEDEGSSYGDALKEAQVCGYHCHYCSIILPLSHHYHYYHYHSYDHSYYHSYYH